MAPGLIKGFDFSFWENMHDCCERLFKEAFFETADPFFSWDLDVN